MTSVVKVQKKGQFTIPTEMRTTIGLADGDYVQVSLKGRQIILQPATILPRTAADQYTPAQRRAIDRKLTQGLADVKAGRTYGPFNTSEEMAASIEANIKKSRAARKLKPAR